MNRRNCIHDEDEVFAPQKQPNQLALCAPMLGFMVAGYLWMFGEIMGWW